MSSFVSLADRSGEEGEACGLAAGKDIGGGAFLVGGGRCSGIR